MRINTVTVSGNLTAEPEGKALANDNYMCRFAIAHNDREKKGDEWVEVAHFFDCLAWGKMAKIFAEQAGKGDPVVVSGTLKQERWEKDGEKHQRIRLHVTGWQIGRRKGESSSTTASAPNADDDIPF